MNARETFNLNKLRCEVAMQQALDQWYPRRSNSPRECPRCSSMKVKMDGRVDGKQRYFCNNCQRAFRERPKIECHCSIPGYQPQCQNCPHFKQFLALVKQKVEQLIGLSYQELQDLNRDRDETS